MSPVEAANRGKAAVVKTVIHIHTDYSFDSDLSLDTLARVIDDEGIGCVAVTDHDTIAGARRLRSMTSARVIVGEEVSTSDGHLIGLFLREHVSPGMSAADTARAIRAQGGLVLLPHPFAPVFGCGLGDVAWHIAHLIDAVEICNSQSIMRSWDRGACAYAERFGLPGYVGCDSHRPTSVAPCYQIMPDFAGRGDFLDALAAAELKVGYHPPAYFAGMMLRAARHCARLGLGTAVGVNSATEPNAICEIPAARAS